MDSHGTCEVCGQLLQLPSNPTGRKLSCPFCQALFVPRQAPPSIPIPAVPSSKQPFWYRRKYQILGALALVSLIVVIGAARQRELSLPDRPPGVAGAFSGLRDGAVLRPAPEDIRPIILDEFVQLPATVHGQIQAATLPNSTRRLELAHRLPPGQAITTDPTRGLLFTAGFDGVLRWFDLKSLRPIGECLLPDVAYQLACDSKHGKLYTAISAPKKLRFGLMGDINDVSGDLAVFSLDDLLKQPAGIPAVPLQVTPLTAFISAMFLHPEQGFLCYVAESTDSTQLGRVDLSGAQSHSPIRLAPGGTNSLSIAPDGKTVYGLSNGLLYAVDSTTWQFRWRVRISGGVRFVEAGPDGRLYLLEYRTESYLLVFDPKTKSLHSRLRLHVEGRPYFTRSADARKLILGVSGVTSGEVLIFDSANPEQSQPSLSAAVRSDRTTLIRGSVQVSDDGRYLLTGNGLLYRIRS